MLSGLQIVREVFAGKIRISPFTLDNVGPNSYDLTIGNKLRVYTSDILDSKKDNPTIEIDIPPEGFILEPGQFYLASTVEHTGSDYYVPVLHGRSSTARLGIMTHLCAGFGDLGWYGSWTLEIFSLCRVKIYPNMSLCQLSFDSVKGKIKTYSGRYQNQSSPTSSKAWIDGLMKPSKEYLPRFVDSDILPLIQKLVPECNNAAYVPWDDRYCVTDTGSVLSNVYNSWKLLITNNKTKENYDRVYIGGESLFLHRLMALTYYGPPPIDENGVYIVRHLDGNPNNANIKNLSYGTYQQNSMGMVRHDKAQIGSINCGSKLTEEDVINIRKRRYYDGVYVQKLADEYGVSNKSIRRILSRKLWGHIDDGLGNISSSVHSPRNFSLEEEKQLADMILSGVDHKEISNMFGLSRRSIRRRSSILKNKNK